ncbi:MAG TPA: trypsin-like serine protease [Polyangiaceae bacterium]|nr:trypsin-like serine protease [Polyangiaceae bacterium]
MRTVLLLSTLLAASACGQAADEPTFGSVEQAIVNGEASPTGDDAAVFIRTAPAEGDAVVCTGTVVAPNLVATALHCVTHSNLGFFTCKPDGSISASKPEDGKMGNLLRPEEVGVYFGASIIGATPVAHGSRLLSTGSTQICRGDLAFVVLDHDIEAPVAAVRLNYGVKTGDFIRVVGYGETEEYGSSGRHVREGRRVIDVGPLTQDEPSISASPRTFVVNEGPCHGDSGGPAFSEETGSLVGVYSLAAGENCTAVGVRNVYSHLSTYSSFVLDAFAAADAEPILDEPPAQPESPGVAAESGCAIGTSGPNGAAPKAGLLGLAALGVGLAFRRRRA